MDVPMGGKTFLLGQRRVASPRLIVPAGSEQSIAFLERRPRRPLGWLRPDRPNSPVRDLTRQ